MATVYGGVAPVPAGPPQGIWTKKKALGAAVLGCVLASGPAVAEDAALYMCQFDRECLEDEACAATEYTADLQVTGEAAVFEDISGTVEMRVGVEADQGEGVLFGQSEGAVHLLTMDQGQARYTLHMTAGPMAITYLGSCKEAE